MSTEEYLTPEELQIMQSVLSASNNYEYDCILSRVEECLPDRYILIDVVNSKEEADSIIAVHNDVPVLNIIFAICTGEDITDARLNVLVKAPHLVK